MDKIQENDSLSTGDIIGITFGTVICVILLIGFGFLIYSKLSGGFGLNYDNDNKHSDFNVAPGIKQRKNQQQQRQQQQKQRQQIQKMTQKAVQKGLKKNAQQLSKELVTEVFSSMGLSSNK